MNWFGSFIGKIKSLSLKPDVDIVSVASLMVSAASLAVTLAGGGVATWYFFRDAVVVLHPPQWITIESHKHKGIGPWYVQIIAPMTYHNEGQKEYTEVVTRESLKFDLNRRFELEWLDFVDTSEDGSKLAFREAKGARPFVVEGKSAATHETRFSYVNIQLDIGKQRRRSFLETECLVRWYEALFHIGTWTAATIGCGLTDPPELAAGVASYPLKITVQAELTKHGARSSSCEVSIEKDDVVKWRKDIESDAPEEQRWTTKRCLQNKTA